MKLPCLSIRQPWAELILNPETRKNIENRTWNTKLRGTVLIHAAKGMTGEEFDGAMWFANDTAGVSLHVLKYILPDIPRGGIVGAARLVDCRPNRGESDWEIPGSLGLVLEQPTRLAFRPYKGALGFFQVELTAAEEDALRGVGLLGPQRLVEQITG
jgi:hypothetical protein